MTYLVMYKGTKARINANTPQYAAHLRLLEVPIPRYGVVTVVSQETEDGEPTAEIFKLSDRKCRLCGCTERKACEGGCAWADWDLCTRCVTVPAAA